jgi:hypothetical protein
VTVEDPTATPDPRRWGTEFRTGKFQRVYWDASLHARRENAWTNLARTDRFTPEDVRGDAKVAERGQSAEIARLQLEVERLRARIAELGG